MVAMMSLKRKSWSVSRALAQRRKVFVFHVCFEGILTGFSHTKVWQSAPKRLHQRSNLRLHRICSNLDSVGLDGCICGHVAAFPNCVVDHATRVAYREDDIHLIDEQHID
jgi:GR25 family glycosyltransferase involved in LPS biosynthesis